MLTESDSQKLTQPLDSEAVADSLSRLEEALQAEKDARLEERFLWIMCMMLMADILLSVHMSFASAIVVVLFELVALGFLAERYGIDSVAMRIRNIIDSIIQAFGRRNVD